MVRVSQDRLKLSDSRRPAAESHSPPLSKMRARVSIGLSELPARLHEGRVGFDMDSSAPNTAKWKLETRCDTSGKNNQRNGINCTLSKFHWSATLYGRKYERSFFEDGTASAPNKNWKLTRALTKKWTHLLLWRSNFSDTPFPLEPSNPERQRQCPKSRRRHHDGWARETPADFLSSISWRLLAYYKTDDILRNHTRAMRAHGINCFQLCLGLMLLRWSKKNNNKNVTRIWNAAEYLHKMK